MGFGFGLGVVVVVVLVVGGGGGLGVVVGWNRLKRSNRLFWREGVVLDCPSLGVL
jgi:hypothetical protein